MAKRKPISPYFKSVHSQTPSPTPKPISTTPSTTPLPRYTRKEYVASAAAMVNFSKLDSKALIAAAMVPSTSQPKHNPKQFEYALEEPKTLPASSRKRSRVSNHAQSSDESLDSPDSSEDRLVKKPSRKKRKQRIVDDDDDDDDDDDEEDHDVPQRQRYTKGKGRTFMTGQTRDRINAEEDDVNEDDDNFQPIRSTKTKTTSLSRKSSSSHKPFTGPKQRKTAATPVPTTFEDAHPADKELFKMKTDGKSWKEIKPVWEKLMGKTTGDSTLSVRYCKMKENFEKAGGIDDIRILKFKAKVEAELEADKWERVAKMTEKDGGKAMTAKEVKLRFKEIEKNGIQVNVADSDNEVPEVTFADMDSIDRELAGLGDVDDTGILSEPDQSNIDESMGIEGEGERTRSGIGELTLEEQRLIDGFDAGNGLERH